MTLHKAFLPRDLIAGIYGSNQEDGPTSTDNYVHAIIQGLEEHIKKSKKGLPQPPETALTTSDPTEKKNRKEE